MLPIDKGSEFSKYYGKKVCIELNKVRKVVGTLVGSDESMNMTLESAIEETESGDKLSLGTVMIKGSSIVSMEALEVV